MKLKLVFSFLVLSLFLTSFGSCKKIENVKIICSEFKTITVEFLGEFNACYNAIDPMTVTNHDTEVSSIIHQDGSDVENLSGIDALQIYNSIINSIPGRLAEKLKNLRILVINWSCLETVSRENMKQFGNTLEHLEFIGNRLTTLDSDLFEHNRNLKIINFSSNPLTYIDPNFFENLKNLVKPLFINFHFTKCMTHNFFFINDADLSNFEWKHENCTSEKAKFEHAVNSGEKACCTQIYRKRK